MGTSASSKGPGGGVPMVPPWVPDSVPPEAIPPDGDAPAPADGDVPNEEPSGGQKQSIPQPGAPQQLSPIAPAARFRGARLNLGKFAKSGDQQEMRRGLRDYVRQGYGGRRE